jgi:serine/threonine protein kinase
MGEVYRARDPRLKREVAIKVLPQAFSLDADRLHRFEQEALATAALNHPNILAVFDIGTNEGSPWVVSELLEGETLRERLRSGSIAVRKTLDYALQIAHELAAAHEKGIIHRDLKPDNLFLAPHAGCHATKSRQPDRAQPDRALTPWRENRYGSCQSGAGIAQF